MSERPLEAWTDYLSERLGPDRLIRVYRETASTQDAARSLISHLNADGALVVAEHQTAGRGRLGRQWISPSGSALTFSLLHRPAGSSEVDRVMFAACVGLAEAVEAVLPSPHRVAIKWPNDLMIASRKLSGMLVERIDGCFIIGIGVNVALALESLPERLRQKVTSFAMLGVEIDRTTLLAGIVERVEHALRREAEDLRVAWLQRCRLLETDIGLVHGGREYRGRVVDIDASRGLSIRLLGGEVIHLPAATTSVAAEL